MKIVEYKDVDPVQVLQLTTLALGFPFTPERAAHMRRMDPRPFPFFAVDIIEQGIVIGQVGVFRLPMVSREGSEDVGGIWAVATHPEHAGRGIASTLLEEAHSRMRGAGLRFSTLGTDRFRVAYRLYERLGYTDMNVWASALAPWKIAHQPTRLRAGSLGPEGFDFVEALFDRLAGDYLGFSRRHTPFARLRENVDPEQIRILWENNDAVGYVFARKDGLLLHINVQLLRPDVDAAEAVAAVAAEMPAPYVQVTMSRPSDIASLRRCGWQVAHPTWDAFMVKPLIPTVTAEDARRLFDIGTDRFLISWLDVT